MGPRLGYSHRMVPYAPARVRQMVSQPVPSPVIDPTNPVMSPTSGPVLPPGMVGRALPPGLARRGLVGPPGLQRQHLGEGPQGTPPQLMAMLATLMLNKKLRSGGMNQPPRIGNPQPPIMVGRLPNQNRMSDLAKMQLEAGRSPTAARYY